ncbi:hypothetical protein Tco_0903357 [Tanacetum coccineum]
MMREEEFVKHVESFKTKIVLRAKKKPAKKSKKVKETYVGDPDQIHAATLISAKSERLRLERIKRQQRLVGGPLEGLAVRNETQDDMDSLDSNKTISTPRLETIVDEREENDALNYTDNVLRYLNETPTPSLEDVGLPRLVQPITNADDPIPSPPIATIITTKPTTLIGKKYALQVKVEEKQRKMDEFIASNVPAAVQESVSAQHWFLMLLLILSDHVFIKLYRILYEMMYNNPESIEGDINNDLYISLSKSIHQDKQVVPKDSCRDANLRKKPHNDQDDPENHKGEK